MGVRGRHYLSPFFDRGFLMFIRAGHSRPVGEPGGMRSSTGVRSTRIVPGALLALGLFALSMPTSARAECGHYASSGSHATDAATQQELLSLSGQVTGTPVPPTPARPGPCPGGICSGKSELPISPAPPPPLRGEQWCCPASHIPRRVISPSTLLTEETVVTPSDAVSTIDRPPRHASAQAIPS
jgi:hypothetical protein